MPRVSTLTAATPSAGQDADPDHASGTPEREAERLHAARRATEVGLRQRPEQHHHRAVLHALHDGLDDGRDDERRGERAAVHRLVAGRAGVALVDRAHRRAEQHERAGDEHRQRHEQPGVAQGELDRGVEDLPTPSGELPRPRQHGRERSVTGSGGGAGGRRREGRERALDQRRLARERRVLDHVAGVPVDAQRALLDHLAGGELEQRALGHLLDRQRPAQRLRREAHRRRRGGEHHQAGRLAEHQRPERAGAERQPVGLAVVQQRGRGRAAYLLQRPPRRAERVGASIIRASESTVIRGVERGWP